MPSAKTKETLMDCGEIRPRRRNLFAALLRETNLKCLILTMMITISLVASVVWCSRTTRITTVNFSAFPIATTRQVSPCDEGYAAYIPAAFIVMLYLLYLVECWHSKAREMLSQAKIDVNTVYRKVDEMRRAKPLIWWRATCYHYVRRTNQFTRYRGDGDAYTTSKVCYERVNSHVATSCFFYGSCGMKDISRDLVDLEKYPVTKVQFNKGFIFSNQLTAQEFQDQRALFFQDQEENDDYMEMKEGLDLSNVAFLENMTSWATPENLPYFARSTVFWLCSFLLLSWPIRVILELNTAHVHYRVTKIFGTNYATPVPVSHPLSNPAVSLPLPGQDTNNSSRNHSYQTVMFQDENQNLNHGASHAHSENRNHHIQLNGPIRPPHAWWRRHRARKFWLPHWNRNRPWKSRRPSPLNLITENDPDDSDSETQSITSDSHHQSRLLTYENPNSDVTFDPSLHVNVDVDPDSDESAFLLGEKKSAWSMLPNNQGHGQGQLPGQGHFKNYNMTHQNWWPWQYFHPHEHYQYYDENDQYWPDSDQLDRFPRSVTLLMTAPAPIDSDPGQNDQIRSISNFTPSSLEDNNDNDDGDKRATRQRQQQSGKRLEEFLMENSNSNLATVPSYSQALLWMSQDVGNNGGGDNFGLSSNPSSNQNVNPNPNFGSSANFSSDPGNSPGDSGGVIEGNGERLRIGRSNSDNYGLSRNLSSTAINMNAISPPSFHPQTEEISSSTFSSTCASSSSSSSSNPPLCSMGPASEFQSKSRSRNPNPNLHLNRDCNSSSSSSTSSAPLPFPENQMSLNRQANRHAPRTNGDNEPGTRELSSHHQYHHHHHPRQLRSISVSSFPAAVAGAGAGAGAGGAFFSTGEGGRGQGPPPTSRIVRSDSSRVLNAVIPRATGVQIDLTNPVSASIPFDRFNTTTTNNNSNSHSSHTNLNGTGSNPNPNSSQSKHLRAGKSEAESEEPPNYVEALRTSRPVFLPPWTRLRRCLTEKDVSSSAYSNFGGGGCGSGPVSGFHGRPSGEKGRGARRRPLWLQDIRPTFLLSTRLPGKPNKSSQNTQPNSTSNTNVNAHSNSAGTRSSQDEALNPNPNVNPTPSPQ